MTQCPCSACGTATAMTFDQALETLIAISIAQLAASGRSDNRRLQEALRIATNSFTGTDRVCRHFFASTKPRSSAVWSYVAGPV